AALLVLDLQATLATRGLTLQDAHTWNVLFDGVRPVFVDFGSIAAQTADVWRAEQEFYEFFIHPLRLMAAGYGRIARRLMHDHERGISSQEVGLSRTAQPGWRAMKLGAAAAAKRAIPNVVRPALRSFRGAVRQHMSDSSTLAAVR